MRQCFILILLAVLMSPARVVGQSLTEAEVAAAIKQGMSGAKIPTASCYAGKGLLDVLGYQVIIIGPVGRIMQLAAEAKRKYVPFAVADVPPEVIARALTVLVEPHRPTFSSNQWWMTPAAEHAVIKRRDGKGADPSGVLQPTQVTPAPISWSNALGGKFEGMGLTALFDLTAFQALPGEELDIAIVNADVEKRCKIGKKDRAALR